MCGSVLVVSRLWMSKQRELHNNMVHAWLPAGTHPDCNAMSPSTRAISSLASCNSSRVRVARSWAASLACSVFNLRDASRAYAAWSEVACTSCKVGERRVVRTVWHAACAPTSFCKPSRRSSSSGESWCLLDEPCELPPPATPTPSPPRPTPPAFPAMARPRSDIHPEPCLRDRRGPGRDTGFADSHCTPMATAHIQVWTEPVV